MARDRVQLACVSPVQLYNRRWNAPPPVTRKALRLLWNCRSFSLRHRIDKAAIARLGLSVATVQDVIGAAIGGREAGVVFEGDRRFPIVIRLNDDVRENVEALKHLPVPLPASAEGGRVPAVLLEQVANSN